MWRNTPGHPPADGGACQQINLQPYRLRIVRDRKEELSLTYKAYPLELVLLPGSARISQPLWRIILGEMRCAAKEAMSAQPLNSAPANSKPGDWYSITSYRTMALAMNMISRSHGSHMKIILCDVYLLPRLGRDRSDVRWVLATEVSRSDG